MVSVGAFPSTPYRSRRCGSCANDTTSICRTTPDGLCGNESDIRVPRDVPALTTGVQVQGSASRSAARHGCWGASARIRVIITGDSRSCSCAPHPRGRICAWLGFAVHTLADQSGEDLRLLWRFRSAALGRQDFYLRHILGCQRDEAERVG
jgi:hypothetical protein